MVLFSGTARDHAEGRDDVSLLEYEAYEEHVEPRLEAIVTEMRKLWPDIKRVVLAHRTGPLAIVFPTPPRSLRSSKVWHRHP